MRKMTLDLDEELFEEARKVLGTEGLDATVQRAFEEAIAVKARQRAIEQLRTLKGMDLDRPEILADAWR